MLEFNLTLIIAMISFVVFMIIMNIVLYKPMREIVEKRQKLIELNEKDTLENKKQISELEEDIDNKTDVARVSSRSIISNMSAQAKKERSEVLSQTAAEINANLENTVAELNRDVEQIKHEIKGDVCELAQEILHKLAGEEVVLTGVSDEEYEKVINNES